MRLNIDGFDEASVLCNCGVNDRVTLEITVDVEAISVGEYASFSGTIKGLEVEYVHNREGTNGIAEDGKRALRALQVRTMGTNG